MEFGLADDIDEVEFKPQRDNREMIRQLDKSSKPQKFEAYVGCSRWNKKDLKNFYPLGTKDELAYYSTQFNSIELNATFHRLFEPELFDSWYQIVPENFRFFPKLEQVISHYRRLKDVQDVVKQNIANMSHLREKLKMPFLQMHDNFGPKDFDRVVKFVEDWPHEVPLAIEFREAGWYNDESVKDKLCGLLERYKVTHIIIDTAGRRDLMHMRLTTPTAFIRWVGVGDTKIDHPRLDDWIDRISKWKKLGLQQLFFFVHQHVERDSPALAAYFIKRLNKKIGTNLQVPKILESQA